jgi:hypothetical protein
MAAFAVVLASFLLPFGTVGCDEERVRVTGVDLVTFSVPGAGLERDGDPNLAQEVENGGGAFALVALACAAAGLVLAAAGAGWWGLLSGVGVVALLALPERAAAELADVWLHSGFVLAVLGFAVAGVTRGVERARRRQALGRRGWPYAFVVAPLVLVAGLTVLSWLAAQPSA